MNLLSGPACMLCRHLKGASIKNPPLTCTAFPNGIPESIASGENDHRSAVDGDHGIRFELLIELDETALLEDVDRPAQPALTMAVVEERKPAASMPAPAPQGLLATLTGAPTSNYGSGTPEIIRLRLLLSDRKGAGIVCGPIVERIVAAAAALAASSELLQRIENDPTFAPDMRDSATAFIVQSQAWHVRESCKLAEEALDDLRLAPMAGRMSSAGREALTRILAVGSGGADVRRIAPMQSVCSGFGADREAREWLGTLANSFIAFATEFALLCARGPASELRASREATAVRA